MAIISVRALPYLDRSVRPRNSTHNVVDVNGQALLTAVWKCLSQDVQVQITCSGAVLRLKISIKWRPWNTTRYSTLLHAAEYWLSSSTNFQHFTELKISSSCSQEPVTNPYTEPNTPTAPSFIHTLMHCPSIYSSVFQVVPSFRFPDRNFEYVSLRPMPSTLSVHVCLFVIDLIILTTPFGPGKIYEVLMQFILLSHIPC